MSSPTLDRPSGVLERGMDPEPENQLGWSCIGDPGVALAYPSGLDGEGAPVTILLRMLFSPFEYVILNFHIVKSSIKKLNLSSLCFQCRLTRNALSNIHHMAYDLQFIRRITTFRDLSVILYHPDIIDIFCTCLSYISPSDKPTQQLSYDTTFNLGDFYLSVLLFRATDLDTPKETVTDTLSPRFESRVAPLFHWVATLGKLFTHIASPVSQLQQTGVQKTVFGA